MTETILPKNVFNENKSDYTRIRPFFNEPSGLFDSINRRFTDVHSLYKQLKDQDWDEHEFDYSTCNQEFKITDPNNYNGMVRTIAYQWETDSLAATLLPQVVSCLNPASEILEYFLRQSENECVVEGTEALTPNGWVDLKDLSIKDKVVQFNPDDNSLEFAKFTKPIEKDFDGDLYEFISEDATYQQRVTPGHRMVKYDDKESLIVETADVFEVTNKDTLPITAPLTNINNNQQLNNKEKLLLVMALSERQDWNDNKLTLDYPNMDSLEQLIQLVEGVSGWEIIVDRARKQITLTSLHNEEHLMGNYKWIDLETVSYQWCRDLLRLTNFFFNCSYNKLTQIVTTKEDTVNILQAIASIVGYTSIITYHDGEPYTYQLDIKETSTKTNSKVNKRLIKYKGKVRCITVPTGLWLMRYKGTVSITGNCLHSATYSEIVRNSFDNPDEVMSDILSIRQSLERLTTVAEVFSKTKQMVLEYALDNTKYSQELYNQVYLFMVAVLCMERIQFMASFAITFNICETTKLFQPIGAAVRKIALDEFEVHVHAVKAVIRHMYNEPEGKIAYETNKQKIVELINEVVENEVIWHEYLFSDVDLVGLNLNLINNWVKFNATDVAYFQGVENEVNFDILTTNPLPFMEGWLKIDKVQMSPQEESPTNYKLDVVVDDSLDDEFDVDF